MTLTPAGRLAARAVDVLIHLSEANLARDPDSPRATFSVTVARRDLVALRDEVEAQYPGVIAKIRRRMAEESATSS